MSSETRVFKDAIYEQFGRIGKAVASPRRIELLDLLCQGPRTVDVLAQQAGLSLANTSHHLQVLRSARLVETVRNGSFVTYRLADADVSAFFAELPLKGQIAAYCRGRYCVLAIEAVETLTAEGFDATRIELGVLDWQAAGYGVEIGSGV